MRQAFRRGWTVGTGGPVRSELGPVRSAGPVGRSPRPVFFGRCEGDGVRGPFLGAERRLKKEIQSRVDARV